MPETPESPRAQSQAGPCCRVSGVEWARARARARIIHPQHCTTMRTHPGVAALAASYRPCGADCNGQVCKHSRCFSHALVKGAAWSAKLDCEGKRTCDTHAEERRRPCTREGGRGRMASPRAPRPQWAACPPGLLAARLYFGAARGMGTGSPSACSHRGDGSPPLEAVHVGFRDGGGPDHQPRSLISTPPPTTFDSVPPPF